MLIWVLFFVIILPTSTRDNSVLEWKGPGFHADLVPGRLRLTPINPHATTSQTIPVLPRLLVGPGQACVHQLIQWLESQSALISKRVAQIMGIQVQSSPSRHRTLNVKAETLNLTKKIALFHGRGSSETHWFHRNRLRLKGTTPQIPTFPQF